MGMKNQDIYEMMARFEASGIARMRLTVGDATLELEKNTDGARPATSAHGLAPAAEVLAPQATDSGEAASEGQFISAPLVGTFYAASAPGKEPFVKVGDRVKSGQTVCLLEAMKMMSEVTAPVDCIIEEILVADGELVSFDAPLIRYREA